MLVVNLCIFSVAKNHKNDKGYKKTNSKNKLVGTKHALYI